MAERWPCLLGLVLVFGSSCFLLLARGEEKITFKPEVEALIDVYDKLNDPFERLRWRRGDPCKSDWTGVICANQSDGYLHVIELRLINKNLSGELSPKLGLLTHVTVLNFVGNDIGGKIPQEIGKMTSLILLLLGRNKLSGPLPDELGNLPKLAAMDLEHNNLSGTLPKSFANLAKIHHFHMSDNRFSGQIPPELSKLPELWHFLFDNNNLSGYLPPEFSQMPKLKVLQLDNNNFEGTKIPSSYANMSKLLKLSLRNCSLQGPVPDFSTIPGLLYIDLSLNNLNGSIPTNRLSGNITTIDLSNNLLEGTIPSSFSGLPKLQKLSLKNNFLSGSVSSSLWQNITFNATARLLLDFQNNGLTDFDGTLDPPPNVSLELRGNPICRRDEEPNIDNYCCGSTENIQPAGNTTNKNASCELQTCPQFYESVLEASCHCFAPYNVTLCLISPSITDFRPYINEFKHWLTSNLLMETYQLSIASFYWVEGPRLMLSLKFFPPYLNNSPNLFTDDSISNLRNRIARFQINASDIFGSYDLISLPLDGPYVDQQFLSLSMSKDAFAGIVLGSVFSGAAISLTIAYLVYRCHQRHYKKAPIKQKSLKLGMKIDGVKEFSFVDLQKATKDFEITSEIGHGGYGKVYRGVLADGIVVAIKRAVQGSLQGQKEFFTEIEFLSRLHHRSLVSLIGYCDEEEEQMVVYEFMANGSLHDILSGRHKHPLNFAMRLQIALTSARGVLYLHTEANPPIIHRDIKATNILLDDKFNAKVSDFGISKLIQLPDTIIGETIQTTSNVKGTPGYIDPEYYLCQTLTEKSDVYSLGVVFLELLTGMQPISKGKYIVREVSQACQSGSMFSIVDHKMGHYPSDCIKRFMALALKCCEEESIARPSMLEVVRELENISSMQPDFDVIISSESDISSSGKSITAQSPLYSGKASYVTSDLPGSNLVSGVYPTIQPR